jgi:hypothetical protein
VVAAALRGRGMTAGRARSTRRRPRPSPASGTPCRRCACWRPHRGAPRGDQPGAAKRRPFTLCTIGRGRSGCSSSGGRGSGWWRG